MKTIVSIIFLVISISLFAQKPAYTIFLPNGKKINYTKVLKQLVKSDVVLFGEIHNNPINHWLELELIKELKEKKELIIGVEMFETDGQKILSDFFTGIIDEETFESSMNLWSNYQTDYKPIVNFAKNNNVPLIGTNIPRQYASLVHKEGFEVLENLIPDEQKLITPLPIKFDPELPNYKKMQTLLKDHGTPNLVKAQAIKDATMAHFILKNHKEKSLFFHINGTYHSDNYEGILWYLKNKNEELNYITISTVEQEDIDNLEENNLNKADFILCVPSSMTKTY